MANGALGGKLIGAGGGGFPDVLRERQGESCATPCARRALSEVRFRFDFEGTKIVI